MMATRLTTLHTPWLTGDTRARVLKANWLYRWYSRPTLRVGRGGERGRRRQVQPFRKTPPASVHLGNAAQTAYHSAAWHSLHALLYASSSLFSHQGNHTQYMHMHSDSHLSSAP